MRTTPLRPTRATVIAAGCPTKDLFCREQGEIRRGLIKKRTGRGDACRKGERRESRGEGSERKGERQGDEEDGRLVRRSRGESKKDG
jgi:hypothetical protein